MLDLNAHKAPWHIQDVDGYLVVADDAGEPVCYPAGQAEAALLVKMSRKLNRLTVDSERILRNGFDPTDVDETQLREINASVWLNACHPNIIYDALAFSNIPVLDVIDPDTQVMFIRPFGRYDRGDTVLVIFVDALSVNTVYGEVIPIQHVRRTAVHSGDTAIMEPGIYQLDGAEFMLLKPLEVFVHDRISDQQFLVRTDRLQLEVGGDRLKRKIVFGEVAF